MPKMHLPCPPEFVASLEGKTLAELVALQDDLTRQRRAIQGQARAVAVARAALTTQEHLDHWGLTAEQYAAAKVTRHKEGDKRPLHHYLNQARKAAAKAARQAQTALAGAANVGTQVKGV